MGERKYPLKYEMCNGSQWRKHPVYYNVTQSKHHVALIIKIIDTHVEWENEKGITSLSLLKSRKIHD